MVSKWVEPPPRPKQGKDRPPYDPDAPNFADIKRQVGKKPPTIQRRVLVTGKEVSSKFDGVFPLEVTDFNEEIGEVV